MNKFFNLSVSLIGSSSFALASLPLGIGSATAQEAKTTQGTAATGFQASLGLASHQIPKAPGFARTLAKRSAPCNISPKSHPRRGNTMALDRPKWIADLSRSFKHHRLGRPGWSIEIKGERLRVVSSELPQLPFAFDLGSIKSRRVALDRSEI